MTNRKEEWMQFFRWLRNGFCFGTTWFLFLLLLIKRQEYIDPAILWYLLIGVAGGALLFCTAFTKVLIRKWGFTGRFTLFMVTVVCYELIFAKLAQEDYYSRVVFVGGEQPIISTGGWLLFGAICLVMYAASMGIYTVYRKKKGELYTQALQEYQKNCRI